MFMVYKLKITPTDHLYENSSIKLQFVQANKKGTPCVVPFLLIIYVVFKLYKQSPNERQRDRHYDGNNARGNANIPI